MSVEALVPIVGGKHGGRAISDPRGRICISDVVRIGDELYVVDYLGRAVPFTGNRRANHSIPVRKLVTP